MIPIVDYHLHTPLCGHAQGEPMEYANMAIDKGLKEIGFSDHAPLVSHEDPTLTMNMVQLTDYHMMIESLRKNLEGRLNIKVGIEADFIPNYEEDTKAIIENYPYDYVIGSVHYIKDWGFDHPAFREQWAVHNVNEVYRDYYELLRRCAKTGMFDVMAHVDLVKKFGHRPTQDMTDEIKRTADVFQQCGVAIEINTSGLRKEAKEIYPALHDLRIYCRAGVPITFGSDAHRPEQVAFAFDQAYAWAKEAGYKEYVLFRKRQIDKVGL